MTLIKELSEAIIEGDSDLTRSIAKEIVKQEINIKEAIFSGLNPGMKKVSELYAKREYFLPEIIVAADALYAALEIFNPYMKKIEIENKGVVVIGVIRGDIHDIGKNITKLFLEISGYKIIDCGRNVKEESFIEAIKDNEANILALSTLMNPTLENITKLVNTLKEDSIFDNLKILIGGAATSEEFAQSIGVKYCKDALEAIEILNKELNSGEKL